MSDGSDTVAWMDFIAACLYRAMEEMSGEAAIYDQELHAAMLDLWYGGAWKVLEF